MDGEVPVVGSKAKITCENGAVLEVRRLKRHERTPIQKAAGFPNNGDLSVLQELMFRSIVTAATGLKDFDGQPVEYRRVKEAGLGEISHADVYGYASDKDVDAVVAFGINGRLDEAQRGN